MVRGKKYRSVKQSQSEKPKTKSTTSLNEEMLKWSNYKFWSEFKSSSFELERVCVSFGLFCFGIASIDEWLFTCVCRCISKFHYGVHCTVIGLVKLHYFIMAMMAFEATDDLLLIIKPSINESHSESNPMLHKNLLKIHWKQFSIYYFSYVIINNGVYFIHNSL